MMEEQQIVKDALEYVKAAAGTGVDKTKLLSAVRNLDGTPLSASEVLAFARRGGVVSVSLLEGAKAEAVEVIMQEGAPAAGKRLMDAKLPKECLVCAYVRAGEAEIPNGTTVLLQCLCQPVERLLGKFFSHLSLPGFVHLAFVFCITIPCQQQL